jgi:hypothetical protein
MESNVMASALMPMMLAARVIFIPGEWVGDRVRLQISHLLQQFI